MDSSVIENSYLIPLLPLLGAIVAGFFGKRWLKGLSHWPIWLGVGASAAMSLMLLFGMIGKRHGVEGLTPGVAAYPYTQLSGLSESASDKAKEERPYRLSASVDWYTWLRAGSFKATYGY